jgi:competence protein CoiA
MAVLGTGKADDAISRAKAQSQVTTAEAAARAEQVRGARLREVAVRFRPGIDRALAKLASEYGVTATVGWSTGDARYAGGVPRAVRRQVRTTMAPDQQHTHQPDNQSRSVRTT